MIDFEKALNVLADARVRFVIVGGLAVTIHGSAYVTYDLDFCYARDAENLSRLAQALQPYKPRLRGAPAPEHVDLAHVPREQNEDADALVNAALDAH